MKKSRSAFSLVELVVSVGVVVTLVAVSGVSVKALIQKARTSECANNLRLLGTSALMYAADNDMSLPVTVHQRTSGIKSWTLTLQEYAGGAAMTVRTDQRSRVVFACPSDELKRSYSYTINDFLTPNPAGAPDLDYSRLAALEIPSRTLLFAEASRAYANSDHFHFSNYRGQAIPASVFEAQVAVSRHNKSANYVFADGHMENLSWPRVQERLSEAGSSLIEPNRQSTNP